ncbi:16S rRNA (uracil(1498)-N(3))-methyltransferase [Croceivirga thetidis]|uniref:Ribosomal RNA small subunit methyltransferase E n=1 Tax=Croceivirga thetidis TaxID=2721623 RepID=A0ABX1GQ01_9FLAO|nr:16S rRNA (uracil(1498)-N(3))-methyltransferase [Croceivirga thetidis]NKI31985.1 16S rRNA (uracil(1498)-N(3))-methyltransferase [Croceivirga thetidis]
MQLFYNPSLDNSFKQFFFSAEESKHIVRVLRKKEGDILHITNGQGSLFEAEILVADVKKCKAQIINEERSIPKMFSVHLAVAPTKMNDRYEWFLEKATEIGIDEITPIICENSERRVIKQERFERVLQAAMKQSLQTRLPKLNAPTSFNDFISKTEGELQFIAHCDDSEKVELKRRLAADKDVVILIGPEGDFSKNEIKEAMEKGFTPITMGKNRLRTETAAVVACATIAIVNA